MEQQKQLECDRICNTIEKTGWGTALSSLVREKMEKGEKTFAIVNPEPQLFGRDKLDMEILVGPLNNDPSRTVLLGMNTLLERDIKIPPIIVEGIDLRQLEQRMTSPPTEKLKGSMAEEDYNKLVATHHQEISRDMKVLLDVNPDIYNRFIAKHAPALDFENPPALQEKQAGIVKDHVIQTRLSSYFNLTPLETYNLLCGRSVNKDLLRKKEDAAQSVEVPTETGEVKGRTFNTWIKANLDKKSPDGSCEIEFVGFNYSVGKKLRDYDFEELKTDQGRTDAIKFLNKGSLVLLNHPQQGAVLVEAAPAFNKLNLYKMTGEIIFNHNNFLKVPLQPEVGEFVELKKKNTGDRTPARQSVTPSNGQPVAATNNDSTKANNTVSNGSTKQGTGQGNGRHRNRVVQQGGKQGRSI